MASAIPVLPTAASLGSQTLQNIGDPYIRLQLNETLVAAVDTRQAQEVLVVAPQALTVVPNMPMTVMGLINHRSRIFWVIDLPQVFGLEPLNPRATECHLAILHVGNIHVGIAVQAIQGVIRVAQDSIASPLDHDLPADLVPYLRGCVPSEQEMLLILDGGAIAAYHN